MTRAPAQAGFTLIELLVSLTLLGLMMAMIGQALPLAMTGAARTSLLSDEIGAIQTVQNLLRRQIGEMPAIMAQDGYTPQTLFSGAPDALRFVANPVAAQGGGQPQIVDLTVMRKHAGAQLLYATMGETRALIADAQTISLSYFGPLTPGREPAWHESWKDSQHLPALVRIQVRPRAGALPWPDLVIAIMAGPPPP